LVEDLISLPEAARRLGVSRQWILKLCHDHRIRGARKVGRGWVIPEGAKIEPPPPRPSRAAVEIPRAKGKTR
jgi:excisionase family DNA binding protein